ncbi:hypothetical protein M8J77_001352 [Diaphorina citri]|nr:hypothetical protein M8J77_001352 [Diaphorina citri]
MPDECLGATTNCLYLETEFILLGLDYVSGGELFTHLYQRNNFTEEEVRIYIGEIILALEHLHKTDFISSSNSNRAPHATTKYLQSTGIPCTPYYNYNEEVPHQRDVGLFEERQDTKDCELLLTSGCEEKDPTSSIVHDVTVFHGLQIEEVVEKLRNQEKLQRILQTYYF